jgi:hypothetical protein
MVGTHHNRTYTAEEILAKSLATSGRCQLRHRANPEQHQFVRRPTNAWIVNGAIKSPPRIYLLDVLAPINGRRIRNLKR